MAYRPVLMALLLGSLPLAGCSIVSPIPLWEFAKATGGLATMALQSEPGEAVHTVYHAHAPFKAVCIEFNPDSPTADVLPALQTALRKHQIESRIYEGPGSAAACPVWLRYSTQMDWDRRPLSDQYQPYLSAASLTLQSEQGRVLSSSQYALDPVLGISKWASTQDKLSPVVAALVTGIVPETRRVAAKKDAS